MRAQITERMAEREAARVIDASPSAEPALNGTVAVAAAVLMPLIDRANGMTVLLTRRSDHLNDHAGQVSFPGGRMETHDRDATETALRETEEEIGLPRHRIEIAGALDTCITGTGFSVVPVVGFVAPPLNIERDLVLDSFEVAEAFEVPLDHVLDPANRKRRRAIAKGRRREFYVVNYHHHTIWGATARMLVNLHEVLQEGP
ncbi:MAG TPA: CoA pyrophosphatase [Alphaproteobacteria bacterium]|jgi:8-oxo-dGTP pyrophosphatase MutT (NUDIX family)|nr:CoA pyrophosphatase [Alphaproteobacteria bacterium]